MLVSLAVSACAPVTPAPAATEAIAAPGVSPYPGETVRLKLGAFAVMTNSPLIIAVEEGYFAKHGLDVELVLFSTASSAEALPALVAGEIDVLGQSFSAGHFNALAQGANFKAVADKGFLNPESCPTEAWVASSSLMDSDALDDPGNWSGLRITMRPGSHEEMMAEKLLQRAGLSLDDIEVVSLPDHAVRVDNLGSGTLDVAFLVEPWITRATLGGSGQTWVPWSELLPGLSVAYLYYGPGMLALDRDVGVRFMTGYLEGLRQYREGTTERNVEILSAFTGLTPDEMGTMCWPSFQPDAKIDTGPLVEFQEWALAKGYLDEILPIDAFWDPSFLIEAQALLEP